MRYAVVTSLSLLMRHLLLLLLAVPCGIAAAQSNCTAEAADCAVVGRWNLSVSLGYGHRSNPIVDGRDIPLIVLPSISYYGKRFFLQNLEFGYTVVESDTQTLSLIAAPGYDRVFFYRNDPQNFLINPMPVTLPPSSSPPGPTPAPPPPPTESEQILAHNRDFTYLAGPEWTFGFGRVIGQLNALYEFTGEHGGVEVRGALALPLIDATSKVVATAGFTWKSAALVTYYYGDDELYAADAAMTPFAKLSYAYAIDDHWSLNAFAHYEWLGAAIADSPIVVEDRVLTTFAGVTYSF